MAKHHPVEHHRLMQTVFLMTPAKVTNKFKQAWGNNGGNQGTNMTKLAIRTGVSMCWVYPCNTNKFVAINILVFLPDLVISWLSSS